MRILFVPALSLALAACGGEAPAEGQAADTVEAAGADAPDPIPVMGPERHILAFGDSLFAGYNLDNDEGYPERLEAALRVKGINAKVADAGVSGDTSAAGLQRLAFVLDAQAVKPDLAIVELGGNDLLRGISPEETRANMDAILAELAQRDIPVLLMGMRAPPNMGPEFQRDFDGLYGDLAKEYGAALVPFFLGPVYDKPQLIQDDRIHPTAQGVEELVAATVDDVEAALPQSE